MLKIQNIHFFRHIICAKALQSSEVQLQNFVTCKNCDRQAKKKRPADLRGSWKSLRAKVPSALQPEIIPPVGSYHGVDKKGSL